MLTYADVIEESEAVRRLLIRDVLPQVDADVCWRMLAYADVC
jgi:hypothetical protein